MKLRYTFTFSNHSFAMLLIIAMTVASHSRAQSRDTLTSAQLPDSTGHVSLSALRRSNVDTIAPKMNMDAVYNRPFMQLGKVPLALGGYVEGNSTYMVRDGVTEGLSFQFQRMTIFMSSTISKRVKFLSEIELEEGGKEINIEFASLDIALHPLLNLRGGVVMNPIGAFNQNHDGPKWEFVNRPLSATTIIPATWSNAGFGFFGKYAGEKWIVAYEAYVTNGFDDKIISNNQNRTWLPASKANPERFTESFNGVPLVTLKTAVRNRKIGEIGISWMGGVYNRFQEDGIELDKKRRVDLLALDFNTTLRPLKTVVTGEFVYAFIDVPLTYTRQFGNQQKGGFLDIVQPVLHRNVLGWSHSTLNLALRVEYVDYNDGRFEETGRHLYDNVIGIVPAISFRPTAQTVLRLNYRYQWERDLLGNGPVKTAGILVGFSSYF